MTIKGINAANTQMGQMGMNRAMDSYSRNILNQIANAQKMLFRKKIMVVLRLNLLKVRIQMLRCKKKRIEMIWKVNDSF